MPYYYDQQAKNNIYLPSEYDFVKHVNYKIQEILDFNTKNPEFSNNHKDILNIIGRMLNGDSINNILKENFKEFTKYNKKEHMVIETYNLNKTIEDLTITNTSILKYIKPLEDTETLKPSTSSNTLDQIAELTGEKKIRWKFWKK
jgi:hypothetical protein